MGPTGKVAALCLVNLAAGAALSFAALKGFGSPKRGPGERPRPRLGRKLGLEDKQAAAVDAILQKYEPDFARIEAEQRARASALRDKIDAELRAILTDAQFAKLKAFRAEFERRGRRR